MGLKKFRWPLLGVLMLLTVGCQSSPEADEAEETMEPPEATGEDTVGQSDEKVNDHDGLEEEGPEEGCPAAEPSGGMCAQVITWALTPEGQCCEYPTPCHVPEGLESYNNQSECEAAAGEASE